MFKRYVKLTGGVLCALALSACGSSVVPMNETGADSAAQKLEQSDTLLVKALSNPKGLLGDPAGFSNLGAAMLGTQRVQLDPQNFDCEIEERGSSDEDRDGIPADARYSIDCSYEDDNGSISIEGATRTRDDDDSDASSGFSVETDAYTLTLRGPDGTYRLRYDLDVDVTSRSDEYGLSVNFSLSDSASGSIGYDSSVTYLPDNSSDPFAGGALSYDTDFAVSGNEGRYALSAQTLDNGLQYSRSCESGFTGGGARVEDSFGSSFETSYRGCGNYTYTKNIVSASR